MLPIEITNTLIVLGMFAVRIGVPMAITLALGYWLEKKLQPKEDKTMPISQVLRRTPSPKIIRLHCWDIKHCDASKCAECAAFKHPDLPCWLAIQVEGDKVCEQCFTCRLYKPTSIAA